MPVPVAITSYSIIAINSTNGGLRAPKAFKLYASNNGTSWTTLQTITNASYTSLYYTNTGLSANTTPYLYYAIVINQVIGAGQGAMTQVAEWVINGKQMLSCE